MATATEKAKAREAQFDNAVEAALLDPTTLIEVPAELQDALREESLEPIADIRFTKLTPRRQGQITDVVMRKFHKDLQDPDLLSDDRIMELAVAKGSWGPAQDARIAELQATTTGQMATLYQEGSSRSGEWSDDVETKAERFLETVKAATDATDEVKDEVAARFKRWLMYSPDKKVHYTAQYAAGLGAAEYNPDKDVSWLFDQAPTLEGLTLLEEIQELRDKIDQYLELRTQRFELDLLIRKRTEIFSNSVESRQRNAGQMARLYFTSEQVKAGKAAGPLAPTFDALYEFPPTLIKWLVEEQFFFHNGIPRAAREYLDEFGFQTADRKPAAEEPTATSDGSNEPTGESPALPQPNSDSQPAAATDASSSAPAVAMT